MNTQNTREFSTQEANEALLDVSTLSEGQLGEWGEAIKGELDKARSDIDTMEAAINSMAYKARELGLEEIQLKKVENLDSDKIEVPAKMTRLTMKLKKIAELAEENNLPPKEVEEAEMLYHICDAIAHHKQRIVPYFQPINKITPDGEVMEAKKEVLVRLERDNGSPFPPGKFLHIAEKYQFNNRIADITFNKALTIAKEYDTEISLNFGTPELSDMNFLKGFVNNVAEKGLDSRKIGVEVLETSDLENYKVLAGIDFLREIGFKMIVDDFGGERGATMEHVYMIQPDVIKLDRGTMQEIVKSRSGENKQEIPDDVLKVLNYAREYDCPMVCEGIEENKELDIIKKLAEEYEIEMLYQGYLLGKPESPESFTSREIKMGDIKNITDFQPDPNSPAGGAVIPDVA
ncbi:MAG: EAL domain-containing protein [Candidatus Gracilibacteria bacterium]|nr:EAL domain-containing protein [Candidatus Gracilibacteria bacterium]